MAEMLRLIRIIAASASALLCAGGYAASQWFSVLSPDPDPAGYAGRVESPQVVLLSAILFALIVLLAFIPRREP
jgi:hypothetical protein